MALKTFVKISTVNNLSDARYCAGMGVNLIGFNLESSSSNFIPPDAYKQLTEWLSGVNYVGEFQNYTIEDIKETVANYSINFIELEDPAQLDIAKTLNLPVILKVSLEEARSLKNDTKPDYLLISGDGSELSAEEVQEIKSLSLQYNILLGTGITDQNVEAVLEATGAKGIALQGGDELRPGYKDYDELADILEALEIDD